MQIFKTVLITGVAAVGLFAVSAMAADTQSDARLREALRKKMAEMDNTTTIARPAAAAAPVAAPIAAPITPQNDAQTEQLRQALHERMEKDAAAEKVTPTIAKPAPVAPVPMAAPALPITATKEQKLDALLQQYKADAITPQQYHEQRAKILAE
jgi:hypothetical protein